MEPNHRSVFKKFAQDAQSHAVVGIIEGWNQNRRVANIEISVTGRKTIPREVQRRRHWQWHHLRFGTVFEAKLLYSIPVFRERPIISICASVFFNQDQCFAVDESADVINVAVRIVSDGSVNQPKHIGHAEEIFKRLVVLLAAQTGISNLYFRIEVTFLSGKQRAHSVYFNTTALDDEILALDS